MKIPAKYSGLVLNYNETFKYLEKEYSRKQVNNYWNYLSERFFRKLRKFVRDKGIFGMKEYWDATLTREKAPYKLEINNEKNVFTKTMSLWLDCPPIRLMRKNNIEIYHDYCGHCRGVYGPLLSEYGFDFKQMKNKDCKVTITKKK